MSRIGKRPIKIPEGVFTEVSDNKQQITLKKDSVEKTTKNIQGVLYELKGSSIYVTVSDLKYKSNWGLAHALLKNQIKGLSQGFHQTLLLEGIGYRASIAETFDGLSKGSQEEIFIKKYGKANFSSYLAEHLKEITPKTALILKLGFSHEVVLQIPEGVIIDCPHYSTLHLSGEDKEVLGQFMAKIRRLRFPEPYKGKGIKFKDEFILRKEGKKK